MVEALTIVLGVGVVRGWRSTLIGVGGRALVLAALVAALGPALGVDPDRLAPPRRRRAPARFGLQWLRKAILRSSGYKALHDEDEASAKSRSRRRAAGDERRAGLDWYSFTVAFKGVLLEGLEVVFIVIAFGSSEVNLGLAAAGAAAARRRSSPLPACWCSGRSSRVPENTIKFAVGLLLTSFGCFWGAEGAGVDWPGDELSLLA